MQFILFAIIYGISILLWFSRFVNVEYQCRFNVSATTLHNAVISLVRNREMNYLKLRLHHQEEIKYNYTVCMGGPWRGTVSHAWFVEWVETNALFGASRILIHNMSMSAELDSYASYYVKSGLLEVLPWQFDPVMDSARTNMQQALLTNCLYRMRGRSRYIVQVDQDELLVPRYPGAITWNNMIEHSGCKSNAYQYLARHLYYGLQYSLNAHNVNATGSVIIDATQRSTTLLDFPQRTKYIANTRIVTMLSNHVTFGHKWTTSCRLPMEVGAIHHYRYRIFNKFTEHDGVMIDNATLKYKDMLTQRIRAVMMMV